MAVPPLELKKAPPLCPSNDLPLVTNRASPSILKLNGKREIEGRRILELYHVVDSHTGHDIPLDRAPNPFRWFLPCDEVAVFAGRPLMGPSPSPASNRVERLLGSPFKQA